MIYPDREIPPLHDLRLLNAELFWVPLGSFKEEASDECAILGMLIEFLWLLRNRDEVELKSIDRSTTGLSTESLEERGSKTSWLDW